MKTTASITVVLAEDHMVVREGLRTLLESEGDIQVVGQAATGREAVTLVQQLRPTVVIMDIAMPMLNGLEATRQIRQAVPATRVLILSAHGDDAYVERVTELGAAGYLIKQTSAHLLAEAIRKVAGGGTFFSPSIAKGLQQRHAKTLDRQGRAQERDIDLSPREAEVLQLIAEGKANKQTAAELGISTKTVEKHRDHLMRKLDIHDTASLTRYAIAHGLIEADVTVTIT